MLFLRPCHSLSFKATCLSFLSWCIPMSYHIVVCLSQTLSHSSFPDHMPFIHLFIHLVFLLLISFCPFSLLPQHLQLEGCHGHPIPNSLSCSSLNLDSWPHICFMLGFPSILVEYSSVAHWWPVNPSHLMDSNLKPSPHAVSCPSGWAVDILLFHLCIICSGSLPTPRHPNILLTDTQLFLHHHMPKQRVDVPTSCLLVIWARCPSPTQLTGLPAHVTGSDQCLGWATPQSKAGSWQMRARSRKKTPAKNLSC